MQFVGLKIAGFKSFVDPVDVPIEQGLTGVVGPNGCGKSNLLEALRWAMGATSARAMRGGEMDDLIFSGTAERPARESAEVTLLLDNKSRSAPAEFNDEDTIEIRRTLRRGAGSSYRINGRTVRAKDVQLLFADASTGANSPALVRQGQISELIGAKPQNRRRILEEAAGIGGLAARRHEAELKLAAAEENLSRLAEIMAEVERQANALKRQAGKARRYKALSEEIAALDARLGAARWRNAIVETTSAREALETARQAEQVSVSAVARASAAELDARSAIDPLRAAETDAAGRLGALNLQLARLEAERDAAREAAARLERDIQRLTEEAARENGQREDAGNRSARAAADLGALPAEDADQRAQREGRLTVAVDEAMSRLIDLETQADERRTALARAEARAASAAEALRREEDRLKTVLAEIEAAESEIARQGDAAGLERTLEAARARHTEAASVAQRAQAEAMAAARAVDDARAEELRLTPPLHEAEKRVRELEAELAGLDRLLRKGEASDRPPVMDAMRSSGLERAVAAALDSDLDAPVDSTAPAHWSGRHGSQLAALPEGAAPLSDLVSAPEALRARLSQCGLVDRDRGEAMQALLAQGQRLVSREGDLWRWDGFVRRSDAPLPAAEKLAQRSRRTAAEAELKTAQAELHRASAARARASSALTAAEIAAMQQRKGGPEAQRLAAEAQGAVMRAEQDVERLALRNAALTETLQRLAGERTAAAARINEARTSLADAPSDDDRSALADLAEKVRAAREQERAAAAELDSFIRDAERAAATRAALVKDRDEWAERAARSATRLAAIEAELAGARSGFADASALPEAMQARLDAMATDAGTAEQARRAAADALAEAEAVLRDAEFAGRAAREQSSAAREALARTEARLEAAIRREAEIAETARSAFGHDLDELEALVARAMAAAGAAADETLDPARADPAALDARLAQLRRDRDGLGAVNMEADDQLAEISGRMGLQIEERDDLVAAIARLREGVEALNQEGRSRLLEAFEAVNGHFKSLFVALFNGGQAELRLTESEDPLDAGLEIFASPPGKRLGALSLMSGGEQALTATALIFAVFLSRPAPLCVLDEVDAPLDDANVDRFCRLLSEMRQRTETRFIVITHNAVSMSRMDRLYGVTMQERGVSRLVSVDLQAAERLAAA
ncbi:MAG: chromosome segregation protein SMC [Alphaproteobacteria bacterium]|nr:chromosome segregation protein SMC [Alphaproteobacteria bacterium]